MNQKKAYWFEQPYYDDPNTVKIRRLMAAICWKNDRKKIEYGTEQELAALIYGEQGVSSLPIQDITGEYIDTDNEYMYYYSAEFVK